VRSLPVPAVVGAASFGRSRITLEGLDRLPSDRVHYLQLGDGAFIEAPTVDDLQRTARSERLYPGEGPTPIRDIVDRFPGLPLALEIIHAERIRKLGYEGFAKTCLDHIRRYLSAI
jgi:hypothetical protein